MKPEDNLSPTQPTPAPQAQIGGDPSVGGRVGDTPKTGEYMGEYHQIDELKLWEENPRYIEKEPYEDLKEKIRRFGLFKPLVITPDLIIRGGNMRYRACKELGFKEVWTYTVKTADEAEALEISLLDNEASGRYLPDKLAELVSKYKEQIDLSKYRIDLDYPTSLSDLLDQYGPEESKEIAKKSLVERFIIPPFSVFDTRQGYWQDRKRNWLDLGIKSEAGRTEISTYNGPGSVPNFYNMKEEYQKIYGKVSNKEFMEIYSKEAKSKGTALGMSDGGTVSVFDPVLCELVYRWFNIDGGTILDPFAGGSVRGVVAQWLGYQYTGLDLSDKQVTANTAQAKTILDGKSEPKYIGGDSNIILDSITEKFDLVFSCPPYFDLEKYTDNPDDLSTMTWEKFKESYRSIISKAVARLKDDRFACFVVADIRGKDGMYRNFVSETISAFESANTHLYNEAILYIMAGSLPIRAGKQFLVGRKLGKIHQNVLVFYKGDPTKIKENYKEVEMADLEQLSKEESEAEWQVEL